jgi:DNA primase
MTVKASAFRVPNHIPRSVDWKTERERIDLAEVIARETGRRPVVRNGRPWFVCPFHEDANPSLVVRWSKTGRPYFRCYGCDARGDAADFIMRIRSMTFPEALPYLTGGPTAPSPAKAPTSPATRPPAEPPPELSGLPEADALALVTEAAARLWSPEGADALAYLTGPRCLTPETIRAARLGVTPGVMVPTRDGDRSFRALGWVIPWFNRDRLALVKVRQPDGRRPKYAEAFRDPSRLVCYPSPATVRPGRPLVAVEGEFDALALGEALGELAAVVTLGSASQRPGPGILGRMLAAAPWFVATDRDEAGDKAAAGWPARARRVRPPGSFKDWTEARQGGVDLARWWSDFLAGIDRPPLFTWPELSRMRGKGADAAPGIDNPGRRPSLETLSAAFRQGVNG